MDEPTGKNLAPDVDDDHSAVLSLLNSDVWQKRLDAARDAREKVLAERNRRSPPSNPFVTTKLAHPERLHLLVPLAGAVSEPIADNALEIGTAHPVFTPHDLSDPVMPPTGPAGAPAQAPLGAAAAPMASLALVAAVRTQRTFSTLRIGLGFAVGVIAGVAVASAMWTLGNGEAIPTADLATAAPAMPTTTAALVAAPAAVGTPVSLPAVSALAVSAAPAGTVTDTATLRAITNIISVSAPPPPKIAAAAAPGKLPGVQMTATAPRPEAGLRGPEAGMAGTPEALAAILPEPLAARPGLSAAPGLNALATDAPPVAAAPAPPEPALAEPSPAPPDLSQPDIPALAMSAPEPPALGAPLVITMANGAIEAMMSARRVTVLAPPSLADADVSGAADQLRTAGFTVRDPVRVAVSVKANHVRYYHADDRETAEVLAARVSAEARDFTKSGNRPPEGTIELWLQGSAPKVAKAKPQKAAKATRNAVASPAPRVAPEDPQIRLLRDRIARKLRKSG